MRGYEVTSKNTKICHDCRKVIDKFEHHYMFRFINNETFYLCSECKEKFKIILNYG